MFNFKNFIYDLINNNDLFIVIIAMIIEVFAYLVKMKKYNIKYLIIMLKKLGLLIAKEILPILVEELLTIIREELQNDLEIRRMNEKK